MALVSHRWPAWSLRNSPARKGNGSNTGHATCSTCRQQADCHVVSIPGWWTKLRCKSMLTLLLNLAGSTRTSLQSAKRFKSSHRPSL
uniref:Uncharacterized protein n=1 Tax=Pseudomonas fluorescens (strain SBW25) TaxID=216595 RepID=A4V752_PSEFS|nr:hypothetical protein pQBR0331 [Pseudomonas fluorescens SBW25]